VTAHQAIQLWKSTRAAKTIRAGEVSGRGGVRTWSENFLFTSNWCILVYFLRTVFKLNSLNKCSVVAEMGDRLVAIDMDRKEGGCCIPFLGRQKKVGSRNNCRAQALTSNGPS